ncbi:MAG: protein translocase subunit SecD [Planctomycetota bacterium]|nr:MAG: protein translocase subunit SecD [Planctomycetota bacterium]
MYENFRWKIITIIVVIIGCALCLYFFDIKRGMDLKGGTELLYQIDVSRLDENQRKNIQDQAKEVLERRLNILGLQDIKIRESGRYGLSIQIPATMNKKQVRRIVERSGKLMLKLLHKRYNPVKDIIQSNPDFLHSGNLTPKDRDWIQEKIAEITRKKEKGTYNEDEDPLDTAVYVYYKRDKKGHILIKNGKKQVIARRIILLDNSPNARISGNLLRNAYPTTDNFGRRAVGFEFNEVGARKFLQITSKNKGRNLAIILDGEIRSMPTIQAKIGAKGIIQGDFSKEEIHELVVILKAGALPAKLITPPSELTTGPGLGKVAIQKGWIASILGFLAVCLFMIIYYRFAGLVANIALFLNLVIILAVLALYHAFLTLPGIAGIVLTVGMSVDANILIFERIREEMARGKTLRHAVNIGYDKAFWAIFDANITTLMTAIILFFIGTGPIKGFAVTLSIGIATSMFTALFVTRVIFGIVIARNWISDLKMMRLFERPDFKPLNWRRFCVTGSALLIIAGMSFLYFGVGKNILGIDFTGGTLIQMTFKEPLTLGQVQDILARNPEYSDSEVQAIEDGRVPGREGSREYQIRLRTFVEAREPVLHYTSPGKAKIAFFYKLERDPKKPLIRLELEKDLSKILPIEKVMVLTSLDETTKKLFQINQLAISYINLGVILKEQNLDDPNFDLKALTSRLEEFLESRYKIVREEVQEKLRDLFKDKLAPEGFPMPKEQFVPEPKNPDIGQIRIYANMEVINKLDEKKLKEALVSEDFNLWLGSKGKGLQPFEKNKVKVIKRKDGNISPYIQGFEILAGPIKKQQVDLYRHAVLEYFETRDQYRISDPFPRVSQIGSAVAKNLKAKAFWAIVFSLFVILAYLTIRFELTFAFGAVVALGHDLFMTLGIIAFADYIGILDIKINLPLIAAFLTILGYSLNDTIVVFDRIRENLGLKRRKMEYLDILNTSISETLSRTVLTSLTTLFVVLVLFLAGVKEIQGFTFALLCGVIVGTYSSIFIATPVVVFYHQRAKKLLERRREEASHKKKGKK